MVLTPSKSKITSTQTSRLRRADQRVVRRFTGGGPALVSFSSCSAERCCCGGVPGVVFIVRLSLFSRNAIVIIRSMRVHTSSVLLVLLALRSHRRYPVDSVERIVPTHSQRIAVHPLVQVRGSRGEKHRRLSFSNGFLKSCFTPFRIFSFSGFSEASHKNRLKSSHTSPYSRTISCTVEVGRESASVKQQREFSLEAGLGGSCRLSAAHHDVLDGY